MTAASVAILAIVLAGCGGASPEVTSPPAVSVAASSAPTEEPALTVVRVTDGDTIETSEGTVRIIGIDAPENGVCGADAATARLVTLLPEGAEITLELPDGQDDTDRHGRLLRYVTTDSGVDVAAVLLESGLAIARYDSTDGYPTHPREESYRAAQVAVLADDGSVLTVECGAQAAAAEEPAVEAAPVEVDAWWRQYSSCSKLKKNTAGHPSGPFSRDDPAEAEIYDWFASGTGHNGDGDGDGLACE